MLRAASLRRIFIVELKYLYLCYRPLETVRPIVKHLQYYHLLHEVYFQQYL